MRKKAAVHSLKAQPLIAVRDVGKSSLWYQALLDCESGHGGDEYERLMSGKDLILQLHAWDFHGHVHLGDPKVKPYGNGVILWFMVGDFDAAVDRARKLEAKILEEPHLNPSAGHREIWLRDRDGYVVVIAGV
jgi:hypothetical protein